ncbi:sulfotransferase family protein [Steroidobacter sp.]|uniref:sulfotransferase family protein n=1 Tax=Steroidobacter sp. TaxID=1978227 RepID=UPI001A55E651|nr:sulfotransferase [Steroidobacter sp.]MBL8270358.1 sulfotransferase [Steroidobacter sp.]
MTLEQYSVPVDSGMDSTTTAWEGPLFIVGMPRSGTKLLRGLLAKHPRIRILAAETDFLPFFDEWVRTHGSPVSAESFQQFSDAMQGANYFNFRPAARGPFRWQDWRTACNGNFDVSGLFEGFVRYELDAERGSGTIWADKSPAYIRHIPLILKHFAGARVLHIVRDVRDHCVSMRNAWGKDIRRSAWRWGQDVLTAHRHCTNMPERCLEVRFEELLQDPDTQMRRICLFLDLQFFPGLTELSQSVEQRGYAAGRTEIVRDNFRKFETRLTPREILAIESLSWHSMQALGYTPVRATQQANLSRLMQRVLKMKDGMHLVAAGMSRRGVAAAVRFHTTHRRMAG